MYRQMDFRVYEAPLKTLFHGVQPTSVRVRKLFSRLNQQHNIGFPTRAFGERDIRKTDQLRIATWFSPGKTLRLLAMGPAACALLAQHAAAIESALNAESGTLLPLAVQHGEHGIEPVLIPRSFVIPRMLLGSTAPSSTWGGLALQVDNGGDWLELAREKLQKKIADGLVMQCFELLDAGDRVIGAHAQLAQWHWDQIKDHNDHYERARLRHAARDALIAAMDLRVTAIAKHTEYMSSAKGWSVMLRDIRFSTPSTFVGEWMIGNEQDAGIGGIHEDVPPHLVGEKRTPSPKPTAAGRKALVREAKMAAGHLPVTPGAQARRAGA